MLGEVTLLLLKRKARAQGRDGASRRKKQNRAGKVQTVAEHADSPMEHRQE